MSMLRSFCAFAVLLLLLSGTALLRAQMLPASIATKIDKALALDDPRQPGYAVAVYRNERLVYAKGFGLADLEHGVPIMPATRFDIGSTSKQFTAASIILLAQDGKLRLDDPIRKYLPEMPPYADTITIRNLLNHTSGLRDYLGLMTMAGEDIDDVTSPEEALRVIARQRGLDFAPGTEHSYSNTGYFLCSIIVERVSGMSLRKFARARIFEPLGMKSTNYIDDHTEVVPNRAIGYGMGEDETYHRDVSNWEQTGDGAVSTTVEDLAKWDANFYSFKVGGPGLPAELMRWGVLKGGDTINYGAGLMHTRIGTFEAIAHGGAWGGYRAQLLRIPSEHISVAVLCNFAEAQPDEIVRKVLGPILGEDAVKRRAKTAEATAPPTPVAFRSELFDAYVGKYSLDEMPAFILTFTRDGDRFYGTATGQGPVELLPTSDSTFVLKEVGASITFHRDGSGIASGITLHQGGDYRGGRLSAEDTVRRELALYAGNYYSSELDSRFTLTVESGKLVARHSRLAAATLTPGRGEIFSGDQWYLGTVKFEIGPDGRASAMLLSAGRNQGMRFERE